MADLHLSGLQVRFPGLDTPALDIAGLRIAAGEMVAVAGPSGSGKSTLVHVLTGLELPGRGAVSQLPTKRNAPEQVVVVQEVHHHDVAGVAPRDLIEAIRAAIRTHHGIEAQAVVLLKPMRIPTTTSGKIQRAKMRQLYLASELDLFDETR